MSDGAPSAKSRVRRSSWRQKPEAMQKNILRVAREIFARDGLSGARVDEIARLAETSKRMIYSCFGDKEGLYLRTFEEAYSDVRRQNGDLELSGPDPKDGLAKLVRFMFEHHRANVDFGRLVTIKNIHTPNAWRDRNNCRPWARRS